MNKHRNSERQQILFQLDEVNTRLKNAREMFADQKMDIDDYRAVKGDCTALINQLEIKLTSNEKKKTNVNGLLDKAVRHLSCLDVLYEESDIENKRQIISSIYPENLTFDGEAYRTKRLNEAVRLIYKLGADLKENKNRKDVVKKRLSGGVVPTGIEPVSKV